MLSAAKHLAQNDKPRESKAILHGEKTFGNHYKRAPAKIAF
jgi:hypothetical protein